MKIRTKCEHNSEQCCEVCWPQLIEMMRDAEMAAFWNYLILSDYNSDDEACFNVLDENGVDIFEDSHYLTTDGAPL